MLKNVKMPTTVGILTLMSIIKFHDQLSWAWLSFITSRPEQIVTWNIKLKRLKVLKKLSINMFNLIYFLNMHVIVLFAISISWNVQSTKYKVRKKATIRNRYNQAQHLTQDTDGKVTHSQLDITNESQEVSKWPQGINKQTRAKA